MEPVCWKRGCIAWPLVSTDGLSVKSERMQPPAGEELHLHGRARQFFFVLAGRIRLVLGDRSFDLGPGQGLEVPPKTPHSVKALGNDAAELLVISAPSAAGDRQGAAAHGEAMRAMRLYDYGASANCLKIRILLAHLDRPYERIATDIFAGDTLTAEYAALNPARLTPVLVVDGHGALAESSAILWFLAEGTPYLPEHPIDRAEVVRWLLFEQAEVGYGIAGLRFRLQTGLLAPQDPEVEARRRRGDAALAVLERRLTDHGYLAGRYGIADIAGYAYVHVAEQAGLDLAARPAVHDWLERIEAQPGFVNDLEPFPADPGLGRGLSVYG